MKLIRCLLLRLAANYLKKLSPTSGVLKQGPNKNRRSYGFRSSYCAIYSTKAVSNATDSRHRAQAPSAPLNPFAKTPQEFPATEIIKSKKPAQISISVYSVYHKIDYTMEVGTSLPRFDPLKSSQVSIVANYNEPFSQKRFFPEDLCLCIQ